MESILTAFIQSPVGVKASQLISLMDTNLVLTIAAGIFIGNIALSIYYTILNILKQAIWPVKRFIAIKGVNYANSKSEYALKIKGTLMGQPTKI